MKIMLCCVILINHISVFESFLRYKYESLVKFNLFPNKLFGHQNAIKPRNFRPPPLPGSPTRDSSSHQYLFHAHAPLPHTDRTGYLPCIGSGEIIQNLNLHEFHFSLHFDVDFSFRPKYVYYQYSILYIEPKRFRYLVFHIGFLSMTIIVVQYIFHNMTPHGDPD